MQKLRSRPFQNWQVKFQTWCTHKNCPRRFKACLTGSIVLLALGISGCGKPILVNLGGGLPDQVYEQVPVYPGRINSVGTLTEGYIQNTEGLLTANARLKTLCVAYIVCEETD